jgi:uncharacterized protein (TIGR00730 family)
MALRSVCVYLASSTGTVPAYAAAARAAGASIARRRLQLVYGGASVGCMGALADAALEAGGRVVGVIPTSMAEREIAHRGLGELIVVSDMQVRKATMFARSDGFLVLPGGFGTLEEVFEVLTAAYLGHHAKPVTFVDVEGYYAPLAEFLDRAVSAGLLRAESRALARFAPGVEAGLDDLVERA